MLKTETTKSPIKIMPVDNIQSINAAISGSWSKIAPFWPLKNLIAVNPIAGLEDLKFEDALKQAKAYFQQEEMPIGMQHVNRESIKWLQAFSTKDNQQFECHFEIMVSLRVHCL